MNQIDNNESMETFCAFFDAEYRDYKQIFVKSNWAQELKERYHNFMWKYINRG